MGLLEGVQLMLEGGADIRYIQQMLGHSDLQSTMVYTQVSIRNLKQIHTATHPGATLEKAPPHPVARRSQTAAEELFAALDKEAAEENQE